MSEMVNKIDSEIFINDQLLPMANNININKPQKR